jgi:hypothetical protein
VHLNVGPTFAGPFSDADSVAAEIDRQIARGYRLFPTHFLAAKLAGLKCRQSGENSERVREFEQRLAATPPDLRAQIIVQYANPVARALELGLID